MTMQREIRMCLLNVKPTTPYYDGQNFISLAAMSPCSSNNASLSHIPYYRGQSFFLLVDAGSRSRETNHQHLESLEGLVCLVSLTHIPISLGRNNTPGDLASEYTKNVEKIESTSLKLETNPRSISYRKILGGAYI